MYEDVTQQAAAGQACIHDSGITALREGSRMPRSFQSRAEVACAGIGIQRGYVGVVLTDLLDQVEGKDGGLL